MKRSRFQAHWVNDELDAFDSVQTKRDDAEEGCAWRIIEARDSENAEAKPSLKNEDYEKDQLYCVPLIEWNELPVLNDAKVIRRQQGKPSGPLNGQARCQGSQEWNKSEMCSLDDAKLLTRQKKSFVDFSVSWGFLRDLESASFLSSSCFVAGEEKWKKNSRPKSEKKWKNRWNQWISTEFNAHLFCPHMPLKPLKSLDFKGFSFWPSEFYGRIFNAKIRC